MLTARQAQIISAQAFHIENVPNNDPSDSEHERDIRIAAFKGSVTLSINEFGGSDCLADAKAVAIKKNGFKVTLTHRNDPTCSGLREHKFIYDWDWYSTGGCLYIP